MISARLLAEKGGRSNNALEGWEEHREDHFSDIVRMPVGVVERLLADILGLCCAIIE
jgi:hypothetical protein